MALKFTRYPDQPACNTCKLTPEDVNYIKSSRSEVTEVDYEYGIDISLTI